LAFHALSCCRRRVGAILRAINYINRCILQGRALGGLATLLVLDCQRHSAAQSVPPGCSDGLHFGLQAR
jgi:hypothetical protein